MAKKTIEETIKNYKNRLWHKELRSANIQQIKDVELLNAEGYHVSIFNENGIIQLIPTGYKEDSNRAIIFEDLYRLFGSRLYMIKFGAHKVMIQLSFVYEVNNV